MALLAVDTDGEWIFDSKPVRYIEKNHFLRETIVDSAIELPSGSIKKLIGRELTWEDEPVEI